MRFIQKPFSARIYNFPLLRVQWRVHSFLHQVTDIAYKPNKSKFQRTSRLRRLLWHAPTSNGVTCIDLKVLQIGFRVEGRKLFDFALTSKSMSLVLRLVRNGMRNRSGLEQEYPLVYHFGLCPNDAGMSQNFRNVVVFSTFVICARVFPHL